MGLVTRVGAEKSLSGVSSKRFKQHYSVPPEMIDKRFKTAISMNHNSIFIAGE